MATSEEFRRILRLACKKAGGVEEWCKENKVKSTSNVYDILKGAREPSLHIALKLGFGRRYQFFRLGDWKDYRNRE